MNGSTSPSASVHRRIEFSDVDSSGRYHYGTVIRLLEAAEVELLAGLGLIEEVYRSPSTLTPTGRSPGRMRSERS